MEDMATVMEGEEEDTLGIRFGIWRLCVSYSVHSGCCCHDCCAAMFLQNPLSVNGSSDAGSELGELLPLTTISELYTHTYRHLHFDSMKTMYGIFTYSSLDSDPEHHSLLHTSVSFMALA